MCVGQHRLQQGYQTYKGLLKVDVVPLLQVSGVDRWAKAQLQLRRDWKVENAEEQDVKCPVFIST